MIEKFGNGRITDQTPRFYDAEAVTYDQKRWGNAAGARLDNFQRNLMVFMLAPTTGQEILEVGTGTGRFAAAVAATRARVTGIDISEGMLEVARKRCDDTDFPVSPRFILGNVELLPFCDALFDSVFCINVVQLFPSVENSVKVIGRVLKPGGHFIFNFPNIVSPYILVGWLINRVGSATGRNKAGRRRSRWFTLVEIRAKLGNYSFAVVNVL